MEINRGAPRAAPQQSRIVEIVDKRNGTLSVFARCSIPPRRRIRLDAADRSSPLRVARVGANDWRTPRRPQEDGRRGRRGSHANRAAAPSPH